MYYHILDKVLIRGKMNCTLVEWLFPYGSYGFWGNFAQQGSGEELLGMMKRSYALELQVFRESDKTLDQIRLACI